MRLEVREVSELRIAQNARQGADPLPTVERVWDRWWTFSRPASLEAPGTCASWAGIISVFFDGSASGGPRGRCNYGRGSSEQQQQQQQRLGTSYHSVANARGSIELES